MKLLKLFLSTTIFIWCVGFFYFFHTTNKYSNDDRRPTDSIIIWGNDLHNLYTGVQLLKLGYAPIIFVTESDNKKEVLSFINTHHAVPEQFIFNQYPTTKEYNYASATSKFLKEYNFHSVRLIVNSYQLPRVMRELKTLLPEGINVILHPISPKTKDNYLVFKEYAKYTLVLVASFIGKENELDLPYS